jgi:hypothetical protein
MSVNELVEYWPQVTGLIGVLVIGTSAWVKATNKTCNLEKRVNGLDDIFSSKLHDLDQKVDQISQSNKFIEGQLSIIIRHINGDGVV